MYGASSEVTEAVQLVADIGGTSARFAYVQTGSDTLQGIEVFACEDFPFFIDAVHFYIERARLSTIDCVCLAVAAVAEADVIDILNNHWSFSRGELQASLGAPVCVVNDFSAQMLSVDTLRDAELKWLGSVRPRGEGVKAIVGAGTGLGVSAMLASGHMVPSQGGHVAFAPLTEHQQALHTHLLARFGRVSTEKVLSGPGLCNLYWANSKLLGSGSELNAQGICLGAANGDALCLTTVSDFWSILGAFAGDIALMMGATGGVYISGGVVSKLLNFLDEGQFREQFNTKGVFSYLCKATPLAIVLAQQPGLRGSVSALRAFQAGSN